MQHVFHETVKALEAGDPCVLVTVIQTQGSTPQKPGAKLLVRADGSGVGTLGGGCVEGDIWFAAKMLLHSDGPAEVRDYELTEELAARDGLICGGTMHFLLDPIRQPLDVLPELRKVERAYDGDTAIGIATLVGAPEGSPLTVGAKLSLDAARTTNGTLGDGALDAQAIERIELLLDYGTCEHHTTDAGFQLFIQSFTLPPTLVVMGGGHISKALTSLAAPLGYQYYVVDDRPEFANPERFPDAVDTIVAEYDKGLERIPITPNTAVVVATRGHRYDDMAAEAAVRSRAGYVGILGSKRKNLLIFEELFRKGIPEERIRAVRAPVGLDLGGRTPEEIALSIMAEIIALRHGASGAALQMDNRLFGIAREKGTAVPGRS